MAPRARESAGGADLQSLCPLERVRESGDAGVARGETPAPSSAELRALAELPKRFYLFNTIGNDVVVTIAGSASEVLFRFLTSALVAVEGEVILFPEPSQTR